MLKGFDSAEKGAVYWRDDVSILSLGLLRTKSLITFS